VTLVGYNSDPKAEEHSVQFDYEGRVVVVYHGKGWDGVADAGGPGRIVRGLLGPGGGCEDPQDARFVFFNTFILVTISHNINRPRSRRNKRLPLPRHHPRALLHLPTARMHHQRPSPLPRVHTRIRISPHDQDGSAWCVYNSRCVPP